MTTGTIVALDDPINVQLDLEWLHGFVSGFEAVGCEITPTSLELPDDLSFDEWATLGSALGFTAKTIKWLLVDWLNYGEASFGEKYAQAASLTGLGHDTLLTYAWVGRNVPKARRKASLSFEAHRIVAALSPAKQKHWLGRAEAEEWSSRELRAEMKEQDALPPPTPQPIWTPGDKLTGADLVSAAKIVVRDAQATGDGYVRVPVDAFARLRSALGEGE